MSGQALGLEFAMTARRTRLLLTGLVGLLVAVAASTAPGAIVHGNAARPLEAVESDLARLFVTEFLDGQASLDGMAGPVPLSSDPSPEGDGPPTLEEVEDLLAAVPAGCQPNSLSQSSGSGPSTLATAVRSCRIPKSFLQADLPFGGRTSPRLRIPCRLLRPPRPASAV